MNLWLHETRVDPGAMGRTHQAVRPPQEGVLLRVFRNDAGFEYKEVWIGRVNPCTDPMCVSGAEGFDAGEVCEHSAIGTIQMLVYFEVVAVAMDERYLAMEGI